MHFGQYRKIRREFDFPKAGQNITRGLIPLALLSTLAVIGTAILIAAPPSDELSGTASPPIGEEMTLTGEVVMIEGDVQIVEDPSSKQRDGHLIMEHLYVAHIAGDEAVQFHVNEKTRMDMDRDLRIGDTVEVLAGQNGEAIAIKKMK